MGLKESIERKLREKMTLSNREKEFLNLQELVKEKGEDSISSDHLMELMNVLEWEDLNAAGISNEKLEDAMAEQGASAPTKK